MYKFKQLLQTLLPYAKYLCLIMYCLVAVLVWPFRTYLPAQLGVLTRDLVAFAFLLAGFAVLYDLLRRPFGVAKRVNRTFVRAGIDNAQHEFPHLRSVMADCDIPHGKILTVENKGISILDFERQISRLEVGFGGKIYRMEYAVRVERTQIYIVPMKHVRPSLFTPIDNAVGRMSVNQIINMLIVGATGTGKAVATKILIYKIIKENISQSTPCTPRIWILDFKKFDFKEFSGLPRYYGYTDCVQGLEDYNEAFKAQQAIGTEGEPNYLIMDEWASFLLSLPKPQAERYKAMLANWLMSGRSYHFIPIIGTQRPDATYFGTARDNFSCCLALGNLSREGRRMIFPDSMVSQLTHCRKREGYLYIDDVGLEKIRIEDIPDIAQLDAAIREAMSR